MDLHDKEILSGEILPAVIIGNGPSGICLSYLLSGYTPYLSPEAWHPNPLLHSKLGEQPHLSLLEQDLEYLCEGLEGRSSNPVAVLFDSLLLPDSDFGLDHTSPLEWRYEPERAVPHLVLGKGPPGGAWHWMRVKVAKGLKSPVEVATFLLDMQGLEYTCCWQRIRMGIMAAMRSQHRFDYFRVKVLHSPPSGDLQCRVFKLPRAPHVLQQAMEGSMLTLSLANWMELPGLKLKDWMRDKRRNLRNDRATPAEIASYYQHYVSQMSLEQNFACGTTVTSVTRQPGNQDGLPPCWRVTGLQRRDGEVLGDGSSISEEVPFSLLAHNVVLATGTHDIPARLGVDGESLPFVCHSFWELEAAISRGELDQTSDPVLVVGAGLTAADAVLAAHHLNTPVYHAFRRSVTDPGLIFNQLPKLLYPEYHKVHQMMTQQQHQLTPPPQEHASTPSSPSLPSPSSSPSSSSYPGYLSFPRHRVVAFRADRKCILESDSGEQTVVQVSKALVLIGSHPNLSFLEDNGRSLGINPEEAISCRRNPIEVDPFTNRVISAEGPGLYAMGPLVGENFVRFLKGGALAIASDFAKGQSAGGEEEVAATDAWLDRRVSTQRAAEVLTS